MAIHTTRLKELLQLHLSARASQLDELELWDFVDDPSYEKEINELLEGFMREQEDQYQLTSQQSTQVLDRIFSADERKLSLKKIGFRLAIAAVLTVIVGLGILIYSRGAAPSVEFTQDIAAGKSGATLTLADGKKIYINDISSGKLVDSSGLKIIRSESGEIVCQATGRLDQKLVYNQLATSNGEKIKVILPDSSVVLMNAASSITYPSTFAGMKNRLIELKGEAYFEVAKDKHHPFIVKTAHQEIEVLGTHFNVNDYEVLSGTKTTLLEGSVKINNNYLLKPGELAINKSGSVKIVQADLESEVAWVKNEFYFRAEPLENVMSTIARWYNVELTYQDEEIKKIPLIGRISRTKSLAAVLERLAEAGHIRFKIEDKKVTVLPN
ncbi:FecR family protein [Pedobacter rhizosphaerae]|uniref:FecR family protein n=1 Tax=Pedobacter rhizosphaerae TaxID=390241 RepID=A0A1H9PNG9_9SPHI|nr:FecR domain-containing protein [Pedobacter rhizosphaerae]SER49123.1 FecR family protein [Pedobacter rhizosphaerae]